MTVHFPKLTQQSLGPDDEIEHFLATFEWIDLGHTAGWTTDWKSHENLCQPKQ